MYVGCYFNVLIKLLKEYSFVIYFWNENFRPCEFYLEIAGVYFLFQSLYYNNYDGILSASASKVPKRFDLCTKVLLCFEPIYVTDTNS